MGLLSSIFQRQPEPAHGEAAPATDAVQMARTRARRRLIGATLLLGIGIIGFPLLFETQPRPIPVNIPIEVPPKDGAPPLALPPPRAKAPPSEPPPGDVITERADEQGRERPPPAAQATASAAPVARAAASAAPALRAAASVAPSVRAAASAAPVARAAASAPAARTAAAASAPRPAPAGEAERVRALLEGKASAAAAASAAPAPAAMEGARFIVQVGAFSEAASAREVRLKIEKLGIKTYTQVAEVEGVKRIRVRVGPFASRDEANAAAGRLRSAGLAPAVLTL